MKYILKKITLRNSIILYINKETCGLVLLACVKNRKHEKIYGVKRERDLPNEYSHT